jgi:hypothetical protein
MNSRPGFPELLWTNFTQRDGDRRTEKDAHRRSEIFFRPFYRSPLLQIQNSPSGLRQLDVRTLRVAENDERKSLNSRSARVFFSSVANRIGAHFQREVIGCLFTQNCPEFVTPLGISAKGATQDERGHLTSCG